MKYKEDLQKLVEAYLKEATDMTLGKIIMQLQPLIGKISRKVSEVSGVEVNDLKQEMAIVIMKRLKSYTPNKGKFITYLMNTCKGDPTDTLQSMVCKGRGGDGKSKYASSISLNDPLKDSNEEITLADTLLGSTTIDQDISYGLLKTIRDHLKVDAQKVFDIIYEDPDTSEAYIGTTLQFSPERVKKLKSEIKQVFIEKGVTNG